MAHPESRPGENNLLERIDELIERFVRTISDLVPAKVADIMVGGLCIIHQRHLGQLQAEQHTIIDHLVGSQSVWVASEYRA